MAPVRWQDLLSGFAAVEALQASVGETLSWSGALIA